MKLLSLGQKFIVNGEGGSIVENHSNFPSSVVSVSEPSDVTASGGGRSMSEEVMIGLEGGGKMTATSDLPPIREVPPELQVRRCC